MIRCHSLLYTQKRLLHYYISDYERTLLPLQGLDTIYWFTQGVATLCPGLWAVAPSGRAPNAHSQTFGTCVALMNTVEEVQQSQLTEHTLNHLLKTCKLWNIWESSFIALLSFCSCSHHVYMIFAATTFSRMTLWDKICVQDNIIYPDSSFLINSVYLSVNNDSCYSFLVKWRDANDYTWDEIRRKKLYRRRKLSETVMEILIGLFNKHLSQHTMYVQ